MTKATYAVCRGKTVQHGVATTVKGETTVEIKIFDAGDPIDLGDDAEHARLLELGVIRSLADDSLVPEGVQITKAD